MDFILSSSITLVEGVNELSNDDVSELSKSIMLKIVKGNYDSPLVDQEVDDESSTNINNIFKALSILMIEAVRVDLDEVIFKQTLSDNNINQEKIDIISNFYINNKTILAFHLNGIGFGDSAEIVDIDWRIDYMIHSKHAGRINEPTIFVTLKVMDKYKGEIKSIDMVCTREELQDLIYKLKAAVKEVDRVK